MRACFTICCRSVAHFEEATCSRLRHITAHLVTNQQLLSLASVCVCVCVCVCPLLRGQFMPVVMVVLPATVFVLQPRIKVYHTKTTLFERNFLKYNPTAAKFSAHKPVLSQLRDILYKSLVRSHLEYANSVRYPKRTRTHQEMR